MATWQADYHVLMPPGGLLGGFRETVGQLLPPGETWHAELEVWGTEDGDRIDVWTFPDGPEVFARFDLREWKPALYEHFVAFVRAFGGSLQDAESGQAVAHTSQDFSLSLRSSRAALFVRDPEGYLRSLKERPLGVREQP